MSEDWQSLKVNCSTGARDEVEAVSVTSVSMSVSLFGLPVAAVLERGRFLSVSESRGNAGFCN